MDSVPVRVKGTQAEKMNAGRDEVGSSRGGRQKKDKTPLRMNKWLIIGVIVLALIAASIVTWQWVSARQNVIDNSKYQAVFFTNGQVYFGKLQKLDDNYMKLTNVFYLQTPNSSTNGNSSQNPQDANKSSQLQLTKLGTEIHSPEDAMVISKSQVLFFENLKDDGKVVQGIGTYYKDQQNK